MRYTETIRKKITVLLLVLFAIGTVPKIYFHDAVARHKDYTSCQHPQQSKHCLHPQGYHCGFDSWVVTSPYVYHGDTFLLPAPFHVSERAGTLLISFHTTPFFAKENRGPPVA